MKKYLPYVIVAAIIIVLVVLSLPKNQGSEGTGIISNQQPVTSNQEKNSPPELVSGSGEANEEIQNFVQNDNEIEVGIKVGNKAPNFKLETFDGGLVELASINKPVVIDFWAAWCPFCIEELPDLEAASQEYKDQIVFLGIHRSETESIAKGQKFADEKGVTYDLLKDTTGSVYDVYSGGQPFMPVAYFIDANGIIKERVLGPKSGDKIRGSVEKLLQ